MVAAFGAGGAGDSFGDSIAFCTTGCCGGVTNCCVVTFGVVCVVVAVGTIAGADWREGGLTVGFGGGDLVAAVAVRWLRVGAGFSFFGAAGKLVALGSGLVMFASVAGGCVVVTGTVAAEEAAGRAESRVAVGAVATRASLERDLPTSVQMINRTTAASALTPAIAKFLDRACVFFRACSMALDTDALNETDSG